MSKLNIYETSWIDVVFENRNKEYGAYDLRQENTKTSFFALLMGVTLLTAAISIPVIYNHLNPQNPIQNIVSDLPPIVVVHLDPILPNRTKDEATIIPEIKKAPTEKINTNQQLTNPKIVEAAAATPLDIATNTELKTNSSPNPTGPEGSEIGNGNSGITLIKNPTIPSGGLMSPNALDKKPEFPGGMNKFYTYVGNNFEKPELDNATVIRVNVAFVIEKDGSMTDIRVLKDPGYGLGAEAIRVLKSLRTKWIPGIFEGQAVRTSYNLPITIQTN